MYQTTSAHFDSFDHFSMPPGGGLGCNITMGLAETSCLRLKALERDSVPVVLGFVDSQKGLFPCVKFNEFLNIFFLLTPKF